MSRNIEKDKKALLVKLSLQRQSWRSPANKQASHEAPSTVGAKDDEAFADACDEASIRVQA